MAYTLDDIGNAPGQAYDWAKRQFISLTKPNEDGGDYTTRSAAIARQQKLAEALSQMGNQEQAVYTAGGITAPMSPMGALARGLTSFGGSYLAGKASADEAALKKGELSEAKDYYAGLRNKPAPYTLPGEGGAAPTDLNIVDPVTGRAAMTTAPRSMQEQRDYAAEARFSDNPMIRSMADSLEARATPKFANLGARGAMDTNPDSPTYGKIIGAPKEKPNELPDSVQVAEWYRTATPEQRKAWNASKNAGRAVTQINVGPTGIEYGKPEEGLVWARDPNGTVKLDTRGAPIAIPYQGGKAYVSNEDKTKKQQELIKQQDMATSIVRDDIRRAKDYIKTSQIPVTGLAGAAAKDIPGTPANALNGILIGIKANIGFDRLQQMRQSSPTGGALGNVSDKDIALVQSVYGSLLQSTNEKDLTYNLDRLDKTVYKVINGTDAPASTARPPLSAFNGKGQ